MIAGSTALSGICTWKESEEAGMASFSCDGIEERVSLGYSDGSSCWRAKIPLCSTSPKNDSSSSIDEPIENAKPSTIVYSCFGSLLKIDFWALSFGSLLNIESADFWTKTFLTYGYFVAFSPVLLI